MLRQFLGDTVITIIENADRPCSHPIDIEWVICND